MLPRIVLVTAIVCTFIGSGCAPAPSARQPASEMPISTPGNAALWHDIDVVLPKNAPRIKSDFNDLYDINGGRRPRRHNGIDIVASVGHPVLAPAYGEVKKITRTRDGLMMDIWHPTGIYQTIITVYLHLNSVTVGVGDFVRRGQQIATVGMTGSTSGGVPHLHFIVSGGKNPHEYWIGGPGMIVCFEPGEKYNPKERSVFTYPVKCYD